MIKSISMTSRLHIDSLIIDAETQRKVNMRKVDKMVSNYDPKKLEPITVSKRDDGTYHIIDGQSRTKMCQLKGISTIPARVIEGLTPKEESELFLDLDESKTRISSYDRFLVYVKAGSPLHKGILGIIKKHGFDVVSDGRKRTENHRISAIRTVERIAENYGLQVLDNALSVISRSWKDNPAALQFNFLEATAKFVSKSNVHPKFDSKRAISRLKTVEPKTTILQAKGTANCSSVDFIVGALVSAYNYHLSPTKRISIA
jgi:ParB-like nuclease domain.